MTTRNQIRQLIRTKRQNLSHIDQKELSGDLLTQLTQRTDVLTAKNIAVYLANDGELDPMLFIHWCWQQNKNIYLPVIHPFSPGNLLFLHYHQNSEMQSNKYGILEPKLDVRLIKSINDIDIIFTPLVAFDLTGNRLGMGGGFYDRTLSAWFKHYRYVDEEKNAYERKLTKPYPIGLAHDIQLIDAIPSQLWDIPLPEIVTPTRQYKFDIHK
ncbi:5-formyltetrahydrofolate cyclo-ligase [Colwellia sp. 6M3]|jgi:5-formyltetrahydrofolate cyclo-ligase|uniref:5-formyltetrahydrofolate cyclo-ligase n=1 Tax=Colwellia sp. 6M3 TaxID=2759849 RepID=UPI0015F399BA|nr:5-formyltetrahydrofolate cyclo-ligase [Colwellia sp. 6M3]MBA6416812.1 5-formyltetrahydrofolate cyclo-ligase [Colwellia sp. 6M3]